MRGEHPMTTPTYQLHPNTDDHRLLRPVACTDCGKPLNDMESYVVCYYSISFFYYCPECGAKRISDLEEENNPMAGQARAVSLHERLVVHLRSCGKMGILQLATAAFGPDDRAVAGLRDDLIANGTLPPDADVIRIPHDRLPRDASEIAR
jgi:predicted RNA-binding Zn-ribbon protein involved in translation (DUF1610 family)